MRTVTVKFLKAHNACPEQVKKFRRAFGDSARITKANCLRAARLHLSVEWLAGFLPAPAQKAYGEALAPAWNAYGEALALAWNAYNEATAPARKAYYEAIALAFWRAARAVESKT
jgi:hypothetical protein